MRKKMLPVCLVLALFALIASTAWAKEREYVKGAWLYQLPEANDRAATDFLFGLKINRVYLGVDQYNPMAIKHRLATFVEDAHSAGMEVHATILEEPRFTEELAHPAAVKKVNDYINYCRTVKATNPKAVFDGIHIRVNPQSLFKGGEKPDAKQTRENKRMARSYYKLVQKIATAIKMSGLQLEFSASVPWWLNERSTDGEMPHTKASRLKSHIDVIVPTVYGGVGGNVESILWRIEDEVKSAPTLVGIGADEFVTCGEVMGAIHHMNEKFKSKSNYRGVIIYEYGGLNRLCAEPVE